VSVSTTETGYVNVLFSTEVGGAYTRVSAENWTTSLKAGRGSSGNYETTGCVTWSVQPDRWRITLTSTVVLNVSESALKVSCKLILWFNFGLRYLITSLGDFTFSLGFPLRLMLSPKFGWSLKISHKVKWVFWLGLNHRSEVNLNAPIDCASTSDTK